MTFYTKIDSVAKTRLQNMPNSITNTKIINEKMMHCMFPLLHPTRHLSGQKEKNYILSFIFICCRRATITFSSSFPSQTQYEAFDCTFSFTRRRCRKRGERILGSESEGGKLKEKKLKLRCPIQKQNKICLPRNFETATSGSL